MVCELWTLGGGWWEILENWESSRGGWGVQREGGCGDGGRVCGAVGCKGKLKKENVNVKKRKGGGKKKCSKKKRGGVGGCGVKRGVLMARSEGAGSEGGGEDSGAR